MKQGKRAVEGTAEKAKNEEKDLDTKAHKAQKDAK